MKRWTVFGIGILLCILVTGLTRTALDPADYTGVWYSPEDQSAYLFQEGLIFCEKHPVAVSDSDFISGSYTFCGDSVFLFAEGISGLEQEMELYLVHKGESSVLCENQDGTGKVYFIRYKN